MNFFTGALLITLGVLTAFAILWMLLNVTKLAFAVWAHKKQREFRKAVNEQRSANIARAKEKWNHTALEELEKPEIKEILEALREVPYIDKQTKTAKKQNYRRQKLQAQLRKRITNPNVRAAIYDMAA